jgi:hypothetical protein
MSKPWFLEMSMAAEPSPLAGIISQILNPSSATGPAESLDNSINRITNGVKGIGIDK